MEYVLIIAALYFVPSIIASVRGHNNSAAIFLLNLFLGWTFLGWVAALVWSATSDTRMKAARGRARQNARYDRRDQEVFLPIPDQTSGLRADLADRPFQAPLPQAPEQGYFAARFTPGTLVGLSLLILVLVAVLGVKT